MAAQAISNIFVAAKLTERNQEQKNCENRGFYLEKIVEQSTPLFRKQCALYFLIEDMLKSSEDSPQKRKKTAAIANMLLHSTSTPAVMVHSTRQEDPKNYIEKILETAEVKAKEDCPLKSSADELRSRFNEVVEYFSAQWETAPSTAELAQRFLASWQEFTRLVLEEKVNSLVR